MDITIDEKDRIVTLTELDVGDPVIAKNGEGTIIVGTFNRVENGMFYFGLKGRVWVQVGGWVFYRG
jgi:hypothetical protein